MYIEDYMSAKTRVLPLEFEIMVHGENKHRVIQQKAGTVFIGSIDECRDYIKQRRAKKALKEAEKGLNPFFTH